MVSCSQGIFTPSDIDRKFKLLRVKTESYVHMYVSPGQSVPVREDFQVLGLQGNYASIFTLVIFIIAFQANYDSSWNRIGLYLLRLATFFFCTT